ncbi:P-loop containing nucleoside triphosphate hydrolase protein [Byssothecium circinans]|uniref:Ribosome-releasing factor 2, mitochondrial n=1 Tax=Byssothecium circinans TaxID=147558 RepID=A0A6A5UBH4_9PLEO|nr:P-loop containing nucleoside triphosphate hydrolase protein [Byssothecium circinans]
MQSRWIWCARRVVSHHVRAPRRLLSTQASPEGDQLSKTTRNIGIIAHIDAGKTTTTERMLYYSGYTRRIGDVDEGSTVTDFLPAERARGITIQSAAITFHWPPLPPNPESTSPPPPPPPPPQLPPNFDSIPRSSIVHNINLIDTPGHADFTFEVLRSLRVLDGAVCILDGVAGVEAQTEKVWRQAGHYQIPRIIFVNKLDRVGAAFSRTVKEVGVRLHGWPAVCQIPWWKGGKGDFVGVGDAIHLRGLLWHGSTDGSQIQAFDLAQLEKTDANFAAEIKKARIALVELLSEHDDNMVSLFLDHEEDHLSIPGLQILQSLRRVILQTPQIIIPIFAGASFRNIGVQPLLDTVVDLLPSPLERPSPEICVENQSCTLAQLLSYVPTAVPAKKGQQKTRSVFDIPEVRNLNSCALAFKVVNDAKRGILVYVRIYSGELKKGSILYNTSLHTTERAPRLLKIYANDAVETDVLTAGQIGVISGLKHARTGDTLLTYKGLQMKGSPAGGLKTLQLRPINVPSPVFFTSIEPSSLSEQKHVQESLNILLREDPSLHLSVDEESGQTHLAGMGDLHLEIARDRLLNDFKAKARIGKIEIGYRETITSPTTPLTIVLDKPIAGKPAKAGITVHVTPTEEASLLPGETSASAETEDSPFETTYPLHDNNTLHISHPHLSRHDSKSHKSLLPAHLTLPSLLSSLHAGASAALSRGPFASFPVSNTRISLVLDAQHHVFPETSSTAMSMAARMAVAQCLRRANEGTASVLMEPVMMVTIFVNEGALGSVVQDLSSSRGGQVLSLDGSGSGSGLGSGSDSPSSSPTSSLEDVPPINPAQIYTPPDPFSSSSSSSTSNDAAADANAGLANSQRQIVARVPLKEMVGYLNQLRALTGGRATFVMSVDGFEKMGSQRQRDVLEGLREFG